MSLTSGLGLKTAGDTDNLLAAFADKGEIPDWARGAIATATDKQLIVNYPNVNQLNPERNATRAEIAAIAHQALVNSGRASVIASPYVPAIALASAPENTCRRDTCCKNTCRTDTSDRACFTSLG